MYCGIFILPGSTDMIATCADSCKKKILVGCTPDPSGSGMHNGRDDKVVRYLCMSVKAVVGIRKGCGPSL